MESRLLHHLLAAGIDFWALQVRSTQTRLPSEAGDVYMTLDSNLAGPPPSSRGLGGRSACDAAVVSCGNVDGQGPSACCMKP